MKKVVLCFALSLTLLSTSCLGSYTAFNNLKEWNSSVSDSKFVNNLVFWVFWAVPVYELFILGDTFIFNVIEFWSGSNPVAMKDGEIETQLVERDGNTIQITATKNRFQLQVVDGPQKNNKLEVFYKPDEKSWNAIRQNGEIIKLASVKDGFNLVYLPNGQAVKIDANATRNEGYAIISKAISEYRGESMVADLK